jgi:hypothetical protein
VTRRLAGATLQAGIVALALVAFFVPMPAAVVESWYSAGLYRGLQAALTSLSSRAPVAVLDVLLVAAVGLAAFVGARAVGQVREARRLAPLGRLAWRLVVAAAVVYVAFLALWGLNYQRVPLAARLDIREGPPATADVVALGLTAAARASELHASAHAAGWGAPARSTALRDGFAAVDAQLGARRPAVLSPLKPTLLGAYFRWAGVDGMVNPFGLEVLGNPDLLPFEWPFVAAHEWAHLAGYADEAEASFVGWLACVRAGGPAAYSGWLSLFASILGEVGGGDRDTLLGALDDGPRADLAAMAARQRRGQVPALRRAGRAVYDQYLRANRVEEGVRRYGAVVTLAVQARFIDEWTPVLRRAE